MMEIKNNEMERLYAETFHQIGVGTILAGKVVYTKPDGVIVDIGYKSEGFIPAEEFAPDEISSILVGSSIEVYVVHINDSDGVVVLSKEKASRVRAWETLMTAAKTGIRMQGCIKGRTKGGFYVDVLGVKTFLPNSQLDTRVIRDTDAFIGKTMEFKVLRLDSELSNVIVSRRAALEEEREMKKAETLGKIREGEHIEGVVKNITDYGVFVDIGGIDGLVHISDISWGRISHPSEFFAVGDVIDVIVLKYDQEHQRITLGYKQKKPDPWLTADEKYSVGATVKGKVVSITDYGAFVELDEGIEGLMHVSEIDWSSHFKHPSKYLSIGETVTAVVLKLEKPDRRISLSMKQLKPNPWELVSMRYAPGQKVIGKIRSLTEFGAFVTLPEGVDGLIHISDISWTRHIKHPADILKKGQNIEAVILSIDPEKERISLGHKQVLPDPWIDDIPARFKLGDEVMCRLLKLTDFGIFVEIEGAVEGLIYSTEIADSDKTLKENSEICARIIKIDTEGRKIGLSMKHTAAGQI